MMHVLKSRALTDNPNAKLNNVCYPLSGMQSCVTENRIVHDAKKLSSNHSRWDVFLLLSKSLWSINESVFK